MIARIRQWPRNLKKTLLVIFDTLALPFAFWLGFSLRMGEMWPAQLAHSRWLMLAAPLVAIPVFVRMGLYRAILRYVGAKALLTIAKAVSIATLLLVALVVATRTQDIPRTVFVIYWLVGLSLIAGSRLFLREFLRSASQRHIRKTPVVIYGAGESGAALARALESGWEYRPVAFVDDSPDVQGNEVHGIRVYPVGELQNLIETFNVNQILLAMPSLSPAARKRILDRLETCPIHVLSLPSMSDLISGRATISDIREVDVGDILGREVVPPIPELLKQCIEGKAVLVTGAGGSIGSELCRQIAAQGPKKLVLYEISEYALYRIERELRNGYSGIEVVPIIGSVTNQQRLHEILTVFGIQTVYHAAAYKHVPLVEMNPVEGMGNNVFGTLHAAQAARDAAVETFVLISTDKAVRPTNMMGASKRLAELVLQALADESAGTRFVMVRFGNVLDSSGSVIPLFREQIRKGGPVTVTHPDVTRYFMTIPEAAQLVLQAGAMGAGGDVFVLDMGDPVKIDDLARKMIHLSGLKVKDERHPDGDVEIVYTGLRPGEKLYEELLIGEQVEGTRHPKIMRAMEYRLPWPTLKEYLAQLEAIARESDIERLREVLQEIVTGYQPEEKIVDPAWVSVRAKQAGKSKIVTLKLDKPV